MRSSAALRSEIEAALADRIPAALTPGPRMYREVTRTGIDALDELLGGGLPVGALTEVIGSECSGRTALALSLVAQITRSERVCAWVDVSNVLSPESAAAAGVDLRRLLWIRCGVPVEGGRPAVSQHGSTLPLRPQVPTDVVASPVKRGAQGGSCGGHPRSEVRGLPEGVSALLGANALMGAKALVRPEVMAPRCAEAQRRARPEVQVFEARSQPVKRDVIASDPTKPWTRIEQALKVTDLLLQAGGFSSIVLDMGSVAPQFVSRIPLATWFRYRAASERTKGSVILLTQHACAKSSAGLVLRMEAAQAMGEERTVLAGFKRQVEVSRQRFTEAPMKVVPLRRPPQRASSGNWQSRTTWARVR